MKITAVLLLIVVVTALVVIWAWNSFESRSETYVREELHQMAKTVKEMARDKPQLKVVAHELKRLGHHAKDSDLAHELGKGAYPSLESGIQFFSVHGNDPAKGSWGRSGPKRPTRTPVA